MDTVGAEAFGVEGFRTVEWRRVNGFTSQSQFIRYQVSKIIMCHIVNIPLRCTKAIRKCHPTPTGTPNSK